MVNIIWPQFSDPSFTSTCTIINFPNSSINAWGEFEPGNPSRNTGVTVISQPMTEMLSSNTEGYRTEDMRCFYFADSSSSSIELNANDTRTDNPAGKRPPSLIEWEGDQYLVCEVMRWPSFTKVMAVRSD